MGPKCVDFLAYAPGLDSVDGREHFLIQKQVKNDYKTRSRPDCVLWHKPQHHLDSKEPYLAQAENISYQNRSSRLDWIRPHLLFAFSKRSPGPAINRIVRTEHLSISQQQQQPAETQADGVINTYTTQHRPICGVQCPGIKTKREKETQRIRKVGC